MSERIQTNQTQGVKMNTPMTATHVFFQRKSGSIIDTCTDENPPRSHIQRETLDEICARYPETEYIEFDEAIKIKDEKNRLPVSEITEKDFWYMLEVLPPKGWKQEPGRESFKMIEHYSGNITGIYARIGERYFTLQDDAFTTHDEIMRRCEAFMNK
ncbi:MAG: hypothetical protein IPI97_14805 [Nitrosomonas sp.]|nr:hypothetical protein [Nitrosomonas sp.]